MKPKQKISSTLRLSLSVALVSLVCVTLFQAGSVSAQEEPWLGWGPGVDCSTTSDQSACETFQQTCQQDEQTLGPFKERCAAAKEAQSSGEDAPDCQPGEPDCCGGVRTSIIGGDLCKGEGEEGGVIFGMLKAILAIMTAGVGIAAVGGIGYGALLYTTAENKPDQTKKAIGVITNVVIGIAAYALMYVLLNFLIPGGVFS